MPISMHLEGFPKTLTPEQQGLFALGFYQQKSRPPKTDASGEDAPDANVPEASGDA